MPVSPSCRLAAGAGNLPACCVPKISVCPHDSRLFLAFLPEHGAPSTSLVCRALCRMWSTVAVAGAGRGTVDGREGDEAPAPPHGQEVRQPAPGRPLRYIRCRCTGFQSSCPCLFMVPHGREVRQPARGRRQGTERRQASPRSRDAHPPPALPPPTRR